MSTIQKKKQKGLPIMQRKSSPSVKISYFDKEAVWDSLKKLAAQLKKERPEIERIILFGSLVRDDCVPGSDVDLLIVLGKSDKPFLERITDYMPSKFPVGVDVFPYTKKELKAMIKEGNFFIKTALEQGRSLFHLNQSKTNIELR